MLASTSKDAACLDWDCSWLNICIHSVMRAVMWAGARTPEALPCRTEAGLLGLTASPVCLAMLGNHPRVPSIAKANRTTLMFMPGRSNTLQPAHCRSCDSLPWHGVHWIASDACIMDWGICIAVQHSTCIHVQSFGLMYRITKHPEFSFKDVRVG
jgi:hypothetical protein